MTAARNDEAAIAALLAGMTIDEAARTAGMGRRTLQRRLTDPEFAQRVADARADVMRRLCDRLTAVTTKAVATLEGFLDDREAPAAARVSAARTLLAAQSAAWEHLALDERVAALEAALEEAVGRGRLRPVAS